MRHDEHTRDEQSGMSEAQIAQLSNLQLDDDLELETEDLGLEDGSEPEYDDHATAEGRRLLIQNPAYFGDIAGILEDPEAYYDDEEHDGITIELPCPACERQLALPDAVMPPAAADDDGSEAAPLSVELMAVLPCGHVFGAECLERHLEEQDALAAEHVGVENYAARSAAAHRYRSCPACAFPLGHEACGHAVETRVYGVDEIPEGRGVGASCRACRLGVPGLMRDMAEDLTAVLRAAGVPAADLAPSRVEYMQRELVHVTMARMRPRLDSQDLEW